MANSSPKKSKRPSSRRQATTSASALDMFQRKPVARMRVSVADKTIKSIEAAELRISLSPQEGCDRLKKNIRTSSKTSCAESIKSKSKRDDATVVVIDDIWKNLASKAIDMNYAIVGFAPNGRPILDHSTFIDLLINHGYRIGDILEFIDDFNDVSMEDDDFPMVMLSKNIHDIYSDVEPFENSIYKRLGLTEDNDKTE